MTCDGCRYKPFIEPTSYWNGLLICNGCKSHYTRWVHRRSWVIKQDKYMIFTNYIVEYFTLVDNIY